MAIAHSTPVLVGFYDTVLRFTHSDSNFDAISELKLDSASVIKLLGST